MKAANSGAPDDEEMTTRHILIVEDDSNLSILLQNALNGAGYLVTLTSNRLEGLSRLPERLPDLILLDLDLPDGDGRQVVSWVRRYHTLPIIVLTVRDLVKEKVAVLGMGADDYIVKPFHMAELLARIAVQFRQGVGEALVLGELVVQPNKRLVTYRGREVRLSPKEFVLLAHLMRHPDRVHSRAELVRDLWGELPEGSNVIDVHFANMRVKFQEVKLSGLFRTVRGYGYSMKGLT